MMPSIGMLSTQIWNTKMESSRLIIQSNGQQMAQFGFGHKFYDFIYFELEYVFHIPWIQYKLEGIIVVENHKIILIWLYSSKKETIFIWYHLLAHH